MKLNRNMTTENKDTARKRDMSAYASGSVFKRHYTHGVWFFYDFIFFALEAIGFLWMYKGSGLDNLMQAILQGALAAFCVFTARCVAGVYRQMWRYGGIQSFIRLLLADTCAFFVYLGLSRLLSMTVQLQAINFALKASLICTSTLTALAMRMVYRYVYKCRSQDTLPVRILCQVAFLMTGRRIEQETETETIDHRIKVAIVGAGRVGISLANDLMSNPRTAYVPTCFFDTSAEKIGGWFCGLPVLNEENISVEVLQNYGVQEVILALPQLSTDRKRELYERYRQFGCKVKVYDFPTVRTADSSKRMLREFDVEELLFRKPIMLPDGQVNSYYEDKVVMITGGGGSIGSEMCRQIAKMHPRRIVILDICENGAYEVQQELRIAYGARLDVRVEIVSVCDVEGLRRAFEAHHPQVVIAAAAHKHVPLMEHNCCEAVSNNVFGTLNTANVSEEFGVERFIMVSTDKAVNPTNVMGATKRMCELIVQSRHQNAAGTTYSATRFGNVLGSAGSVIPLFKRQIANGGPITLTDKRIIRYFMTIPEASQLVLQSAMMAKSGELFVLDMGQPVKIVDLAENMIRLSGLEPYIDIDIVETGLRPGEKLYEELLVKDESLGRTDNHMIFIEKDAPLSVEEVETRLNVLRQALATGDDERVKAALHEVVPTYHDPETVNATAAETQEMKDAESRSRMTSGGKDLCAV